MTPTPEELLVRANADLHRFRQNGHVGGDTAGSPCEWPPPLVARRYTWRPPSAIPPRRWLLGTIAVREHITLLAAAGGTGKTTLAIAAALSVATGRALLGEHVFERAPAWVFNLEDPLEEIERRVAAALLHHGIAPEEVDGRLFLNSGRDRRVTIAGLDGSTIVHPDKAAIVAEAKRLGVGLIVVDPFLASHELTENDNQHMNAAARAWAEVAAGTGCAVLLVDHTRKGSGAVGLAGDIEAARGGKALADAARVCLTLAAMTPDEAERCGVPQEERWRHVRLDDAKANLAPRAGRARWFRLVSVALGNGAGAYPNGDSVQAVERWTPPSAFGDLTDEQLNAVLDAIEKGWPDGSRYTAHNTGKGDRYAGDLLVRMLGLTPRQAKAILEAWIRSGLLLEEDYEDPAQRKIRKGLRVDDSRRPGTECRP